MNPNEFTTKTQEAIVKSFEIAKKNLQKEADIVHLVKALSLDIDGTFYRIFTKLNTLNFPSTHSAAAPDFPILPWLPEAPSQVLLPVRRFH